MSNRHTKRAAAAKATARTIRLSPAQAKKYDQYNANLCAIIRACREELGEARFKRVVDTLAGVPEQPEAEVQGDEGKAEDV